MGLLIKIKNYDEFSIGYMNFTFFRMALAKKVDNELGVLYKRWLFGSFSYTPEEPLSDKEFERFKELAGDLIILLAHSDCDGIIQPHESRKLYKALENIELDFSISGYCAQKEFNVLEKFKKLLEFSWKNRRRIIFS